MLDWTWEPDDFAALWLNDGRDRIPRPLSFTSRFRYREEAEAHAHTVRERYDHRDRREIERALDVLSTGTVRIEVFGDTHAPPRTQSVEYRVLGACTDLHAVIATQHTNHGGTAHIAIRRGSPDRLGAGITAVLPRLDAGCEPKAVFDRRDLTGTGSYLNDVAHNGPRDRYQRTTRRPLSGSGCAAIYVGSRSGSEPIEVLEWLDYADDGRYIQERTTEQIRIEPAGPADIADRIARMINRGRDHLTHSAGNLYRH